MQRRTFLRSGLALGTLVVAGGLPRLALSAAPVKVGALLTLSGPAGIFGPAQKNCAELAVDEINARGGLVGRLIELVVVDAGAPPAESAQAALKAWQGDGCEAFVGTNDSAVRQAVNGVLQGKVLYIYVTLYEGKECSPGVQVLGETPDQQLRPVVPWLAQNKGVRKWYLIGNDYNWPRDTNVRAKDFIAQAGGTVVGEEYLPFTVDNFDTSVGSIKSSGADVVLITLVGGSSIGFNRAFASFGLAESVMRVSTGIEELTLMGIGAQNSKNLFASGGYFTALETGAAKDFMKRYAAKFGTDAPPLSYLSQSAYDGFLLLESMVKAAHSFDAAAIDKAADGVSFESPRGHMVMHDRHSTRDIYLVEAEGDKFRIVQTFPQVPAGKNC
jgi:urea transport system substrate-binding protein